MGKTVAGEAPMGGSRVIRGPRRWVLLTAVLVLAPAGLAACASASSSTPASSGTPASSSTPATSSTPASSPTPSPSGPFSSFPAYLPAPASRMLLGTYISLSGQASTEAAIEQREAAMGHRYNLQLTYYNWDSLFPDSGEATIVAHGRTPVVTWYGPGKDADDPRTLAEVINGSDDGWIRQQAQVDPVAEVLESLRHRIYLRLMP